MGRPSRDKWLLTPKGRFYQQRCSARQRGIEFRLSFDEWWGLWKDKYHLRGKADGDFCMCRVGDEGAYEIGNVFIDTINNNTKNQDHTKSRSNCKLDQEKADKIRELLELGISVKQCAFSFGVARQTISDIKWRRTWR